MCIMHITAVYCKFGAHRAPIKLAEPCAASGGNFGACGCIIDQCRNVTGEDCAKCIERKAAQAAKAAQNGDKKRKARKSKV